MGTITQTRWQEIVNDPSLQDLPYKVETNERGQIVLSPHSNLHSLIQGVVYDLLRDHAPPGLRATEFAISTPQGTKVPDVVWMTRERYQAARESGDPSSVAPDICIEIVSDSNTAAEMEEKRKLYLEAGAQEVWLVDLEGRVQFFAPALLDRSRRVPDFPGTIEAPE